MAFAEDQELRKFCARQGARIDELREGFKEILRLSGEHDLIDAQDIARRILKQNEPKDP